MLTAKPTAIAICFLILAASPAFGSLIGVAWTGDPHEGPLYEIDPATGAATSLGVSTYPYSLTGGPQRYQVIVMSPVNPYIFDISTGQRIDMGMFWYLNLPAYDTDRRQMWATGVLYPGSEAGLFSFSTYVCDPCMHYGTYIGPLGIDGALIDYVSGVGLYGISGSMLYTIDRDTGHATFVAPIFDSWGRPFGWGPLGSIQDFAYDADNHRLILATGPNIYSGDGLGPHGLYTVGLGGGMATLLTDQGPYITGIARMETPEPAALLLVAFGLLLACGKRVLKA